MSSKFIGTLYDQIGKSLVGRTLCGALRNQRGVLQNQHYLVKGYTPFGNAEDIDLEVETEGGFSHRIRLTDHLGDLIVKDSPAQSSPKLTRREKKALDEKGVPRFSYVDVMNIIGKR